MHGDNNRQKRQHSRASLSSKENAHAILKWKRRQESAGRKVTLPFRRREKAHMIMRLSGIKRRFEGAGSA